MKIFPLAREFRPGAREVNELSGGDTVFSATVTEKPQAKVDRKSSGEK